MFEGLPLEPSHADSVTDFQIGMIGSFATQFLDNTHQLMAQANWGVEIVFICATDSAVRDLHECFVWAGFATGFAFDDVAGLGAFENFEFCRHGIIRSSRQGWRRFEICGISRLERVVLREGRICWRPSWLFYSLPVSVFKPLRLPSDASLPCKY
jgi:hypothetical protein